MIACAERSCKKEKAPQTHRVKNALPNSPPQELLTDTIDSQLNVVNGTGVLSPGTNGLAKPADFSHSCNLRSIKFAGRTLIQDWRTQ